MHARGVVHADPKVYAAISYPLHQMLEHSGVLHGQIRKQGRRYLSYLYEFNDVWSR